MYRHFASWEVETTNFGVGWPKGEITSPAGPIDPTQTTISEGRVTQILGGNLFALNPVKLPGGNFTVPPGTTLRVVPATRGNDGLELGEIVFENRYCTFRILTRTIGEIRGAGVYQILVYLSDAENLELASLNYTIVIEAKFSRLLSGNPEMPRYVQWASSIASGLQDQFDERITWDRSRDQMMLWKLPR